MGGAIYTRYEIQDNSFAIVAVRCNSHESIGKRILEANRIYYLLDGYDVENPKDFCTHQRKGLNSLYDDFILSCMESNKDNIERTKIYLPHVQVSAIVGKNGSGKSTLIEFIMRLINNAAAIAFKGNNQLKWIYGVDGDLWYIKDHKLWRLSIRGNKATIFNVSDNSDFVISSNNSGYSFDSNISQLFYTIISNYSLYAYNSRDYVHENIIPKKGHPIELNNNQQLLAEDKCWISSLFHKNDGYQAPLVLTPLRTEGNMDINVENELARERLITLLINNKRFRTINNHLHVDGITISRTIDKDYGIKTIIKKFGLSNLDESAYLMLRILICEGWGKKIGQKIPLENSNIPNYDLGIQYLVYKTLKIAYTYDRHKIDLEELITNIHNNGKRLVNQMLKSQFDDYTHITRKIYQTLAYLIYPIYRIENTHNCLSQSFTFDDINIRHGEICELKNYHSWSEPSELSSLYHQSLIPPPFLDSFINLHEKDNSKKIIFESLSSGEKQLIFTISSMLYHLDNLNSVSKDNSLYSRINYPYIFMILEEVELYFHPEMQQEFIKLLMDGIRQSQLDNIKGIHILLVTHSPYVLSDIPKQNVLALTQEGVPSKDKLRTFCANIHEMLRDSFFLSKGSQGLFAQWEIGFIIACLKIHKEFRICSEENDNGKKRLRSANNKERWDDFITDIKQDPSNSIYSFINNYLSDSYSIGFDYKSFSESYSEDYLQERIAIIDEPLIRSILQREFNEAFKKSEEEILRKEIAEREQRLAELGKR